MKKDRATTLSPCLLARGIEKFGAKCLAPVGRSVGLSRPLSRFANTYNLGNNNRQTNGGLRTYQRRHIVVVVDLFQVQTNLKHESRTIKPSSINLNIFCFRYLDKTWHKCTRNRNRQRANLLHWPIPATK